MAKKLTDLTGQTFNKLTVVSFWGKKNKANYWNCICDCGNTSIIKGSHLKSNSIKSCGCLIGQACIKRLTTHGFSNTPEYYVWTTMKARCLNPNNKSYKNYGKRGIIVCEEWLNSFETFILDMGLRPSKEYSLERINNNDNYCKQNCRWATRTEQANNTRQSLKVINTETNEIFSSIADAARNINMKTVTLNLQLNGKHPNKTKLKLYDNK